MKNCYLCGRNFNNANVLKHKEHIIQQAIGGVLKPNDILCSTCGNKLSSEIDTPFNQIFQSLATRLDIKKDREEKSKTSSTKATFEGREVMWKEYKVFPVKPFYEINDSIVTIYCADKQTKKYLKKVENELKEKNINYNKIVTCNDITGIISYPFEMDNKAFKKGLAKIAIGYASHLGIHRECLPLVLDIDNDSKEAKIKDEIHAIAYYPFGFIEKYIEDKKDTIEPYPFHNLILFTLDYDPEFEKDKKILICYVELFSTFQYYVVLSEDYEGENIYKTFAQEVLKKDDPVVALGRRYYKERNIWLDSLSISEEYIEKKFNDRNDKSKTKWDIEEELIKEETQKQKHSFDFEKYIYNNISQLSNELLLQKNKDKMFDFYKELHLFYPNMIEERFHIENFRKMYFEGEKVYSYFGKITDNYTELLHSGRFKEYMHKKFYMLEDFIQNTGLNKKFSKRFKSGEIMNIINIAKEVFKIESKEIANLSNLLTEDFESAVNAIYNSKGKFIICGMGKSGLIGKKIAATLASTGTPSFFLHPGEAYHGDLGMIEKQDVVLLISNSGETDEVLKVIPFLKSQENITISMSGNSSSTLAKNTTYHLNIAVQKEACPLQLAPTSSTTATLVMGDALAVALMKLRDFKDKDFAQFHPGGSLGRRLLTTIESVMKKENLPVCSEDTSIKDVVHIITNGKCGLVVVMENKTIKGIITDGDIRRAMEYNEEKFFSLKAKNLMSCNPKTISKNEKLTAASELMNNSKVNSLLVVDGDNILAGIVQMYDLEI
jgi:arabinose-5-phosphate isomerase